MAHSFNKGIGSVLSVSRIEKTNKQHNPQKRTDANNFSGKHWAVHVNEATKVQSSDYETNLYNVTANG